MRASFRVFMSVLTNTIATSSSIFVKTFGVQLLTTAKMMLSVTVWICSSFGERRNKRKEGKYLVTQ